MGVRIRAWILVRRKFGVRILVQEIMGPVVFAFFVGGGSRA